MKKMKLLLSLFLLVGIASCNNQANSSNTTSSNESSSTIVESSSIIEESSSSSSSSNEDVSSSVTTEPVDFAANVKFDPNDTSKVYAEVTVHSYIDGDTTHFVPVGTPKNWIKDEDGVLKARYNCVDTPESTGKVEPWGVAAKKYTNSHLKEAKSIIVQSDTNTWNTDSTGVRYLVWVWYKAADASDYRLLNLELVQEGLAKLKSASNFSLADVFQKANLQSMQLGLKLYNTKLKDPDFYYGDALPISLKELRLHIDSYKDKKVSVEGLITYYDSDGGSFYITEYEGSYAYSIGVYLGFNTYDIIKAGNYLRVVGTVQYFDPSDEGNGTWQISGVTYRYMNPDHKDSMKVISEDNEVTPFPITYVDLSTQDKDKIIFEETVVGDDGEETINTIEILPGNLYQGTYVKYSNLEVYRCYTTQTEGSKNKNAITMYCRDADGNEVVVRTSVMYRKDDKGNAELVTQDEFVNKTINVLGIVDHYNDSIQIHVFQVGDITFVA